MLRDILLSRPNFRVVCALAAIVVSLAPALILTAAAHIVCLRYLRALVLALYTNKFVFYICIKCKALIRTLITAPMLPTINSPTNCLYMRAYNRREVKKKTTKHENMDIEHKEELCRSIY